MSNLNTPSFREAEASQSAAAAGNADVAELIEEVSIDGMCGVY